MARSRYPETKLDRAVDDAIARENRRAMAEAKRPKKPRKTRLYKVTGTGGWMTIVRAATALEAYTRGIQAAESASLGPSDINSPTIATDADLQWYERMGGVV